MQRSLANVCAQSYREAMREFARMSTLDVWYSRLDVSEIGRLAAAKDELLGIAAHDIRGITGPAFDLYAFPFSMSLPEGTSVQMWGFGDQDAGANATHTEGNGYNLPQYPGPTLVVNQGDTVTINLTNYGVPQPVSIVVSGHNATAAGGVDGLVTKAATTTSGPVTYTFVADEPGDRVAVYETCSGAYLFSITESKNHSIQSPVGVAVNPADGEHGFIRLSEDGNSFVRGDGRPIRFWAAGERTSPDQNLQVLNRQAQFLANFLCRA